MTVQPISRRCDGYTLIEMLVVLLLVGLIATATSAGLRMGTRVWEHSEVRIAELQSAAAAQTILRNWLTSAIPRREDRLVRFHGEPDFVAFDMPPPRAFGGSGLVRAEIWLVRTGARTGLRVKLRSLTDARRSRETMLTEGAGALRLAYLDSSSGAPVWLDYWRDRPRLPDAVRVTEAGAGTHWPAFVAHLAVSQAGLCEFDPVSTSCRNP